MTSDCHKSYLLNMFTKRVFSHGHSRPCAIEYSTLNMWRWQFDEVTSNGKWKGAWIFHPRNCRGRSDRTLLTCKLYHHPWEILKYFLFEVSVCIYSIILWSAVTTVSSDEEDRWSFKRSIKALAACALGQNIYQIIFLIVQKTELTFNLLENVRLRYRICDAILCGGQSIFSFHFPVLLGWFSIQVPKTLIDTTQFTADKGKI